MFHVIIDHGDEKHMNLGDKKQPPDFYSDDCFVILYYFPKVVV